MDISSFKTFLNEDVLKMFTEVKTRAEFVTTSKIIAGDNTFIVPSGYDIVKGDKLSIDDQENFIVTDYDSTFLLVSLNNIIEHSYAEGAKIVITYNFESTLSNALEMGQKDARALVTSLKQNDIPVRFDEETYALKSALIYVYTTILQKKATKKKLSVPGVSISSEQEFDHYKELVKLLKDDLEQIREDAYQDITDEANKGTKGGGLQLFHRSNRSYMKVW